MTFSFIHLADIHLGRPFSDLPELGEKKELCNQACTRSFNKITDFAISKKVDFVLIAGDSFDSEEHDLSSKLLFRENLKRLADNGIKSYIICGNHDSVEVYKKNESYFRFDSKYDGLINITGVNTPENIEAYKPIDGVNIYSASFKGDESENQLKYLPKIDDKNSKDFNIGLLHCDLDKTESKYAPTSREDLRNLGYDYYALGHIHIPEVKESGAVKIVYAGSPQGRTKKETGAHGCYYAEVNGKTVEKLEFIPTDFVRFSTVDIDCSDCENKLDVFEEITNSISGINEDTELSLLEINLSGVTNAYKDLTESENLIEEYRQNFGDIGKTAVYRINNDTVPCVNESEFAEDNGIIGIIHRGVENGEIDLGEIYDNISEIHEAIYKKLGLDSESKDFLTASLKVDKEEITESAKKEIKSLCSEIYSIDKV